MLGDHPDLMWMVRHAAYLHDRYNVGQDGRTPWERTACTRAGTAMTEFGERVMFMTRGEPRPTAVVRDVARSRHPRLGEVSRQTGTLQLGHGPLNGYISTTGGGLTTQ